MKYFILVIVLFVIACNKSSSVPTLKTSWIDVATLSDTIITNAKNLSFEIYYAKKNWQQLSNINIANGYRFIAIKFHDSVLVQSTTSNNSEGPFLFKFNTKNDTLTAQNFLDTSSVNPARTFIQLP